jgi:hypothetical protein
MSLGHLVTRWVLACGCDPHVERCSQCDERRRRRTAWRQRRDDAAAETSITIQVHTPYADHVPMRARVRPGEELHIWVNDGDPTLNKVVVRPSGRP